MKPSINAADLIASHADTLVAAFEGDKLKAYQDANGVWTIGYGHTGPDVHSGLTWTEDTARAMLKHDMLTADNDVLSLVAVPLNQNQYDALASFDYNLGHGHVEGSTTLHKLNAGDYQGAADAMLLWIQPGSANEVGLLRRRTAERALFLKAVA